MISNKKLAIFLISARYFVYKNIIGSFNLFYESVSRPDSDPKFWFVHRQKTCNKCIVTEKTAKLQNSHLSISPYKIFCWVTCIRAVLCATARLSLRFCAARSLIRRRISAASQPLRSGDSSRSSANRRNSPSQKRRDHNKQEARLIWQIQRILHYMNGARICKPFK